MFNYLLHYAESSKISFSAQTKQKNILSLLSNDNKDIFFLLSISTGNFISAANIVTFLPNTLPSNNKKSQRASHPIPLPEILYLSGS